MAIDQIQIPERAPDPLERFTRHLAASKPGLTYRVALQALTELDPTDPGDRGKLGSIRAGLPRHHPLAKAVTRMLEVEATPAPGPPKFMPWEKLRPSGCGGGEVERDETAEVGFKWTRGRAAEPLTGNELAWLQSLPSDPGQVSEPDVERLVEMSARYPKRLGKRAPDGVLVDQVLDQVKRQHERLGQCAELLAQAGIDAGSVLVGARPAGLAPAAAYVQRAADWESPLSELVLAEVPGLTEAEAKARVRDDLSGRWMDRDAARVKARQEAFEALSTPEMKQAVAQLAQAAPQQPPAA
jgi:hypothetical protein